MISLPPPRRFASCLRARATSTLLYSVAAALFLANLASAAVTITGNVNPNPITSSGSFYVGQTASGSVLVDGGSTITTSSSYLGYDENVTGSVTITDPGSKWNYFVMRVGYEGDGDIKVLNGATVSGSSVYISYWDTASGTALVSGPGSIWTSSFFTVGDDGFGILKIENGGLITSSTADIGDFGGTGVATVTGVGSAWNISSSLRLGTSGDGTLNLENGATISSGSATIGGDDLTATFTITGPQSAWTNAGDATIGSFGNGALKLLQGGQATIGGDTTLGRGTSAVGAIHFDNGTLNTGGLITRLSDLKGTGTINTHGLVADLDLLFDATHGFQQQYLINSNPGQNITINLDATGVGAMGAGHRGQGSLTIADGRQLLARDGILGYDPGSTGTAVVDGANSRWKMSRNLTVGTSGAASLTIQNGAAVEVATTTTLGASSATASITFNNGTLMTNSFIGAPNQLLGTGTVNTRGVVTDIDLVFDNTHPLQQQFTFNTLPNQNVVLNLDVATNAVLGAGFNGQGSLTITDGKAITSSTGYLGYRPGSTGTATVTGPGSSWTVGGQLSIGPGGTGNLSVSGGGTVTSGVATITKGLVTVTGAGSTWNNAGDITIGSSLNSTSELRVLAGGKVTSATASPSPFPSAGLGYFYGSTGTATVDGAGSNWTHNGVLFVGGQGTGHLNVTGGGAVNSGGAQIGSETGGFNGVASTVTVTGAGSRWTNTGALSIGAYTPGVLNITSGGAVTSTAGIIGDSFSSNITPNAVTVSGQGSSWIMSGGLNIGYFGGVQSSLTIQSGAAVQAGAATIISPSGRLNLQGGSYATTAISFQSSGGQFNWTGGKLHVGTYSGNLTNSAGILAPGQPIGKTTVSGSYTQQTNATLQIEIAGLTATTQYDNVAVSSLTTLGGTLQLSLLNNFIPSPTSTFTILTSTGTLSGALTNVTNAQRLLTTDGLGTFRVNYGTGSTFNTRHIVLSAFNITGDFNTDGKVDAADYTYWRRNTGATVPRFTSADADGSGLIDTADYTIWRSHFGLTAPAGAGATAFATGSVPEPSIWPCLLLTVFTFCTTRLRAASRMLFDSSSTSERS